MKNFESLEMVKELRIRQTDDALFVCKGIKPWNSTTFMCDDATTSWVKEIAKAKVNKASQFIKGEKRFSERFSIPVIAIISECDAICAKILVADLMMCFMSRNWIRSEEICVVTLYKMMPLRNWAVWYRQRCSYTF